MKDLQALNNWNDKQLRTIRNNLNNRLESFKKEGATRPLQASNVLFDKNAKECADLLAQVKTLMNSRASKVL